MTQSTDLPKPVPMVFLPKDARRENVPRTIKNVMPIVTKLCEMYEHRQDFVTQFYFGLRSGLYFMCPASPELPDSYDPRERLWFLMAQDAGKLICTPPYHAAGSGRFVSTISKPFYLRDGKFAGVVSADFELLRGITPIFLPESPAYGATAYIIDVNDVEEKQESAVNVITWCNLHKGKQKEIDRRSKAMRLSKMMSPALYEKFSTSIKERKIKKIGVMQGEFEQRESILAYGILPRIDLALLVAVPITTLRSELDEMADIFKSATKRKFWFLYAAIIIMISTATLIAFIISRAIAKPLKQITQSTREIATGNFDCSIPKLSTCNEIEELTDSISKMQKDLAQYIRDFEESTAAKERFVSELRIAHGIQMSFVPTEFSLSSEIPAVDIYGILNPAREVGGDFYDFFTLDQNHVFFAIGDVSDKGVPAALFMVMCMTLLKAFAHSCKDLSSLLQRVNKALWKENRHSMFITLTCGVLDLRTGQVQCTNAGHVRPIILRTSGVPEMLSLDVCLVLGALPDTVYTTQDFVLQPGDGLFLYTDGVTEARGDSPELFSETRLMAALAEGGTGTSSEVIQGLRQKLEIFMQGNHPLDDITLLLIRYMGAKAET